MIRVLIAHREMGERQALRQGLAAAGIEVVGLARDGQEAVQMALQHQPEVTLLDAALPVLDGHQAAEMIGLARPGAVTLLLVDGVPVFHREAQDGQDKGNAPFQSDHPVHPGPAPCEFSGSPEPLHAEILRRAMRAGARDVLFCQGTSWNGMDLSSLVETVKRLAATDQVRQTQEYRNATDPARMPMTITITGAKGGVGKTTLCVNLAVALAQEHPGQTLLVDLYSQWGDVATLLNLQPRRTLADLVPVEGELDLPLIEEHLEEHESGLRVLVGSVHPQPLDLFTTQFLERVMGVLKRQYRFLIVDVPPFLHPGTLYMLGHSQAAVLVANLFDLTTASDTQKLLQTLRDGYVPPERLHVVLNRVSRENQLQVPDLEKAFGQKVAGVVPNDGRIVPASINNGVPFVTTHPKSGVTQAVRALARSLTGTALTLPQPAVSIAAAGTGAAQWLQRALFGSAESDVQERTSTRRSTSTNRTPDTQPPTPMQMEA